MNIDSKYENYISIYSISDLHQKLIMEPWPCYDDCGPMHATLKLNQGMQIQIKSLNAEHIYLYFIYVNFAKYNKNIKIYFFQLQLNQSCAACWGFAWGLVPCMVPHGVD